MGAQPNRRVATSERSLLPTNVAVSGTSRVVVGGTNRTANTIEAQELQARWRSSSVVYGLYRPRKSLEDSRSSDSSPKRDLLPSPVGPRKLVQLR